MSYGAPIAAYDWQNMFSDNQMLAGTSPLSLASIMPGDQAGLPNLPTMPKIGGAGNGMGFMPTAQLALSGLGTLGTLWSAFQGLGLAKKQFAFQKDFAEKNLANQTKSYNTALEDKARSRAVVEGQSADETKRYIDLNRLSA